MTVSSWIIVCTYRVLDKSCVVGDSPTLRLTLFKDQMLYISIDTRTGRFILRDSGDLAAWERGYRFAPYANGLNSNPALLLDAVFRLRFNVSRILPPT